MLHLGHLAIIGGLLGLWVAVLLRRRTAGPVIGPATVKFTHVLPAVLQVVLFAYWSIYWPPVVSHLPVIAAQLVFAYVFDFLFAWTRRRPYTPSLGPVPIVLSANLFVWFLPGDLLLACLVVAIALTSRSSFLRNGHHIFNPSALGVAVVGASCILLPEIFQYRDISHDFDRAPHMAPLILLLAIIPQWRLGTAPVALGAAIAMIGTMLIVYSLTGHRGGPTPWWPPWLLAITLLAGDPATIPSTPASRLLFGLFLGVAYYIVSRALLLTVGTDFFAKVLPIPLANFLVPVFQTADWRLSMRWPIVSRQRIYVAVWLSLSLVAVIFLRGRV
jgi:hypothetical protein